MFGPRFCETAQEITDGQWIEKEVARHSGGATDTGNNDISLKCLVRPQYEALYDVTQPQTTARDNLPSPPICFRGQVLHMCGSMPNLSLLIGHAAAALLGDNACNCCEETVIGT